MIVVASNFKGKRFKVVADSSEITVEITFDVTFNERVPVLGTKDDVEIVFD